MNVDMKEEVDWLMKRAGRHSTVGMLLCMVGVCVLLGAFAMFLLCPGSREDVQPAKILFAGTEDDADCAILLSQDTCVMIDTGEEQDAEHILTLLEQEQVEKIDCLILTHPDKDHIGGAPALMEALSVDRIVVPDYGQEKESYETLIETAEALGSSITVMAPAHSRDLRFGDLSLCIWPPEEAYYEKDNDYSLAVLVRHGGVKMFFAGDAQKRRMKELLTYSLPKVDLYKVSYHGRDLTTGARLIGSIRPRYAVVTADAPGPEIEQALRLAGAQVYCTRGQDAVFVSDGELFSCVP